MMTTTIHRESAKIYQFPMGGRAGLASLRSAAKPADDRFGAPSPQIVFGGGWYHDAAVQEADQVRKR